MESNALSVEFVLDHLEGGARRVTSTIDGRSLIELVRLFEAASGFDVPGGYDGLIIDHFRFGDLDDYLAGRTEVWPGRGRVALLGCNCGEVGCWPLFARVREVDDYVVWDRLEQPHRPRRDYEGLGPFRFGRLQYEAALSSLMAQAAL